METDMDEARRVAKLDQAVEHLRGAVKTQCTDGIWDQNPYMMGLANGLIMAQAILTGEAPIFKEIPEVGYSGSRAGSKHKAMANFLGNVDKPVEVRCAYDDLREEKEQGNVINIVVEPNKQRQKASSTESDTNVLVTALEGQDAALKAAEDKIALAMVNLQEKQKRVEEMKAKLDSLYRDIREAE